MAPLTSREAYATMILPLRPAVRHTRKPCQTPALFLHNMIVDAIGL